MTARAAQAAPVPPRAATGRWAARGLQAGQSSPWCRSASTATAFRPCPIAMVEAAGPYLFPWPVLARLEQLASRKPVPANMPARKLSECELLHINPVGRALDVDYGPEKPPTVRRPHHRLRPDRHRHRGHPARAALSLILSRLPRRRIGTCRPWDRSFPRATRFSPPSNFLEPLPGAACPLPDFWPKAVKRECATAAGFPATHCVNRA
jgi:hypothetical protein